MRAPPPPLSSEGTKEIVLGIFVLLLALLMWRLTSSTWGWAVLFLSGSFFVLFGWWKLFRD
jgi:membrane-bound ClpP family serine protease